MKRKLVTVIASTIQARLNCIERDNAEWLDKHEERILALVKNEMPSGCGIDCGTRIELEESRPDRLVFTASYHHMNESGMYDGWTNHKIIVTPSLVFGYNLRITGRDRNKIKEYLHEDYFNALETEVEF